MNNGDIHCTHHFTLEHHHFGKSVTLNIELSGGLSHHMAVMQSQATEYVNSEHVTTLHLQHTVRC